MKITIYHYTQPMKPKRSTWGYLAWHPMTRADWVNQDNLTSDPSCFFSVRKVNTKSIEPTTNKRGRGRRNRNRRIKLNLNKVQTSSPKLSRTGKKESTSNPIHLKGTINNQRLSIFAPFFFKNLSPILSEGQILNCIDKQAEFHDGLIKNHGIADGTRRYKRICQYAIEMIEGNQPQNLPWVATGRIDRWPTKLSHLRPLFIALKKHNKKATLQPSQVKEIYRFILSLLKINRVKADFSQLDVSNITKRHKLSTDIVNQFEKFVINKLSKKVANLDIKEQLNITPFFSPSRGPNKLPMEESAGMEAYEIFNNRPEVSKAIITYCEATGNEEFSCFLKASSVNYGKELSEEGKCFPSPINLRKLISIPDKGNKSRTIAIVDFWTQNLLSGLEAAVIRLTTRLYAKNSAYNSHSRGFEILKEYSNLPGLVSIDAEAWTDNFPAALQYIVLKHCYGRVIADCWKTLAIDCDWVLEDTGQYIRYGKGQAMGTKGSFVIAQLTCMLFVDMFLQQEYGSKTFFMEVGDDLVLDDPKSFSISWFEKIGVPINWSKSKKLAPWGHFMEFVSRNTWDGHDISIISFNLLSKWRQNDFYILTVLHHLQERGIDMSLDELINIKASTLIREGYEKKAEKLLSNSPRIILLASLMSLSQGSRLGIDDPYKYLAELTPGMLRSMLMNLIINPGILLLNYQNEWSRRDRDTRIAEQKSHIHASIMVNNGEDDVWNFSNNQNLSLSELKRLSALSHLWEKTEERQASGYEARKDDANFPLLLPLFNGVSFSGRVPINLNCLVHLVKMNIKLISVIADYKVINKLSILDKANTPLMLELMGILNRSFNLKTIRGNDGDFAYSYGNRPPLKIDENKLHQSLKEMELLRYFKSLESETRPVCFSRLVSTVDYEHRLLFTPLAEPYVGFGMKNVFLQTSTPKEEPE